MAVPASPPTCQGNLSSISNSNAPISVRPPRRPPSCSGPCSPSWRHICTTNSPGRTDDNRTTERPHWPHRALPAVGVDLPLLLHPVAGGDLDVAQDVG